VGISSEPPAVFDADPTPLLFHAREQGDEPLQDSVEARRRGWARLVLFASYLRPEPLEVPSLLQVLRQAFRPGLRSPRTHFGLYPFAWQDDWHQAAAALMGDPTPRLQVAPVLERLVLPRARQALLGWLDEVAGLESMRWLVPAHYSAPLAFTPEIVGVFKQELFQRPWAPDQGSWDFLAGIDTTLLRYKLVPTDPFKE